MNLKNRSHNLKEVEPTAKEEIIINVELFHGQIPERTGFCVQNER